MRRETLSNLGAGSGRKRFSQSADGRGLFFGLRAALYVLLLSACAGAPVAVEPTTTPVPTSPPAPTATLPPTTRPTNTPRPTSTPRPTATPAASATAASSASGQLDDRLGAALVRTAAVQTYSATINVAGLGFPGAAPGQPANLLGLNGRFDETEHEFIATGLLAAFLGADPVSGLQAARVDGTSYVRGPLAMIGAVEPVWYRLPPERAALADPPLNPAALRGILQSGALEQASLAPAEPIEQDGQQCTPFTGDTAAALVLLRSLNSAGVPQIIAPEQVQTGAITVLVCADGFVHALTTTLVGAFPGEQPTPFELTLDARLADFAGSFAISAPQGARELPTPPAPTARPTP